MSGPDRYISVGSSGNTEEKQIINFFENVTEKVTGRDYTVHCKAKLYPAREKCTKESGNVTEM